MIKKAQKGNPARTSREVQIEEKVDDMLSTREVLRGKYVDFREVYKDAEESVLRQLKTEISPETLKERLNKMQKTIAQDCIGGIEGLKIDFDARHSDLLYEAEGKQVEEQAEFLFRMARTFIEAFLRNTFYDLYEKVSHKRKEDLYPFVLRMAKKYAEIKATNPEAEIRPYLTEEGNIRLKAK